MIIYHVETYGRVPVWYLQARNDFQDFYSLCANFYPSFSNDCVQSVNEGALRISQAYNLRWSQTSSWPSESPIKVRRSAKESMFQHQSHWQTPSWPSGSPITFSKRANIPTSQTRSACPICCQQKSQHSYTFKFQFRNWIPGILRFLNKNCRRSIYFLSDHVVEDT